MMRTGAERQWDGRVGMGKFGIVGKKGEDPAMGGAEQPGFASARAPPLVRARLAFASSAVKVTPASGGA